MNRNLFMAMVVCSVVAAGTTTAMAAELKIGAVDFNRVLEESPQYKAAAETLNKEFAPAQQEIQAQNKELRSLQEKLQRDSAVMSGADRASLERRVRDMERDLARRFEQIQEDMNIRRNEELSRLQRQVGNEIRQFAKDEKYDLILAYGVIYAAPTVDVTERILKRLEASAAKQPDQGSK